MVETLRWGILGAAKFAREHMGPAIHAADNAVLAALATSSAEKAAPFEAMAPGLQVFTDYDALLASDAIDAIYIPLPNHLHVEWTMKALEAGKHVLVEKPLAMRAEDFDPVIAKRDETGLLAAEAYMIVHHPQWQKARDLVQGGAIGTLVHVDGVFGYNNASDPSNIRNDAGKGGGGIPDIGVYTYGSTRFVTGEEPVEITHADIDFEHGVDVVARASARFPTFTAHWVNSMRVHPYQRMTFIGDQGWLELTAPFNPLVFGEARIEMRNGDGTRIMRFPGDWHYKLQVEAFGHSVRTGDPYPCPLEFSRGTQVVIDKVFAAAQA